MGTRLLAQFWFRTQLPESLPGWLLPGDKKPVVPGGGDGNVDDGGGSFNQSFI